MKCLETRTTPEGYKRRRYASATGVRYTTIEVPIEVWHRVNAVGRQRDRAAQVTRRLDRESKQRQAVSLHAAGKSTRQIEAALGVSRRTVRRWVGAT